jgi:hypothetical protein
MCGTKLGGEIVDNSKRKERIFILQQPTKPGYHQCGVGFKTLPASSTGCLGGETVPDWWFHHFEPVWRPFIQKLCRHKKVTLLEFEQAASQVHGLTHIEKTIAISAFRQQQEQGLVLSHTTTAFRSERGLSAV